MMEENEKHTVITRQTIPASFLLNSGSKAQFKRQFFLHNDLN